MTLKSASWGLSSDSATYHVMLVLMDTGVECGAVVSTATTVELEENNIVTNPWVGQGQSRLNYIRRADITHTSDIPGAPSSGDQGATTHLPHKATLPTLGNIQIYLIYKSKYREEAKMG